MKNFFTTVLPFVLVGLVGQQAMAQDNPHVDLNKCQRLIQNLKILDQGLQNSYDSIAVIYKNKKRVNDQHINDTISFSGFNDISLELSQSRRHIDSIKGIISVNIGYMNNSSDLISKVHRFCPADTLKFYGF